MSFVVTVVFVAKPEFRADFRKAMLENAEASRLREPACRQFDVCESSDRSQIFLYEIYDDEAAFKTHLATEHFKRFDERVKPWVAEKRVVTYQRVNP